MQINDVWKCIVENGLGVIDLKLLVRSSCSYKLERQQQPLIFIFTFTFNSSLSTITYGLIVVPSDFEIFQYRSMFGRHKSLKNLAKIWIIFRVVLLSFWPSNNQNGFELIFPFSKNANNESDFSKFHSP